MANDSSFMARAKRGILYAASRFHKGSEADKASSYWGNLPDYHLANDDDPIAIARSKWLADTVLPPLGVRSVLEIGTNSGRNLQHIHQAHPEMELKGIDVNPRAIAFANSKGLP